MARLALGLGIALVGGAAFKSLEVYYSPFLIDRGYAKDTVGWFSLGPMIGLMTVGAIAGGFLADWFRPQRIIVGAINGCESWSAYTSGQLIKQFDYSTTMWIMSALSLLAVPLGLLVGDRSNSMNGYTE